MDKSWEEIGWLSASPLRIQILDVLNKNSADLRELKAELENPRTTLQRNLSSLEERGWIKYMSGEYTTTTKESLLLQESIMLCESIEKIRILAPFLDAIDNPSTIDIRSLSELNIIVPSSTRPYHPTRHLLNSLGETKYLQGFLPAVPPTFIQQYLKGDRNEMDIEIILSENAFTTIREQYGGEYEPTDIDKSDVLIHQEKLPYGLFVFNRTIILTAHDEMGRVVALLEAQSEKSIDWGRNIYEKHKQRSVHISKIGTVSDPNT